MKLLERSGIGDPAASAAMEEYCVRHLPGEDDLLLLYVNSPAVVIGRHQVPPAEADLSFLSRRRIALLRRLSGGGAVFHDPGNLNFAFVTAYRRSRFLRYDRLLAPVVDVLREMGAPARFQAPNAVVAGGRKVSGNAQFTDMSRMLTHGTLLFCADLDSLARALRPDDSIYDSAGVASAPAPVVNLSRFISDTPDMEGFRRRFRQLLEKRMGGFESLRLSEEQNQQIEALSDRYRSWEWTWGRSPRFEADRRLSGSGGRLRLTVERGIVRKAVGVEGVNTPPRQVLSARYDELVKSAQSPPAQEPGF